jgi:hypothetical protein
MNRVWQIVKNVKKDIFIFILTFFPMLAFTSLKKVVKVLVIENRLTPLKSLDFRIIFL